MGYVLLDRWGLALVSCGLPSMFRIVAPIFRRRDIGCDTGIIKWHLFTSESGIHLLGPTKTMADGSLAQKFGSSGSLMSRRPLHVEQPFELLPYPGRSNRTQRATSSITAFICDPMSISRKLRQVEATEGLMIKGSRPLSDQALVLSAITWA